MNSIQEDHARRLITEKCLIAADVDQTILAQTTDREEEKRTFFRRMAPQLVDSARLGVHVGFITGNSMHELCSRFLSSLVEQLCHTRELALITRFHFFCNSGGLYFHFPQKVVDQTIERNSDHPERLKKSFLHATTFAKDNEVHVHSAFLDAGYIERCIIRAEDADIIAAILERCAEDYLEMLNQDLNHYEEKYDLSWVRKEDGTIGTPQVQVRSAAYRSGGSERSATVQITLKPVLSFRQARSGKAEELFGKDPRIRITNAIQTKLDHAGLGHYVARPGGRASIDVTLERLDKAYALEFLIDHLRLQGNTHRGQHFGSNAIYFGDEVMVGGGNDYPVTRLPGLLVFAVNRDRELVPFLRDVFVPSAIFAGPEATADVLTHFNSCARRLLKEHREDHSMKTAIEALKEEIFASRITEKIARLRTQDIPADDWQTLHTFVTLLARDTASAREWPSVLVKQLDTIMTQLSAHSGTSMPQAPGTSHPDNAVEIPRTPIVLVGNRALP